MRRIQRDCAKISAMATPTAMLQMRPMVAAVAVISKDAASEEKRSTMTRKTRHGEGSMKGGSLPIQMTSCQTRSSVAKMASAFIRIMRRCFMKDAPPEAAATLRPPSAHIQARSAARLCVDRRGRQGGRREYGRDSAQGPRCARKGRRLLQPNELQIRRSTSVLRAGAAALR